MTERLYVRSVDLLNSSGTFPKDVRCARYEWKLAPHDNTMKLHGVTMAYRSKGMDDMMMEGDTPTFADGCLEPPILNNNACYASCE